MSMTGFGEARGGGPGFSVSAEIRAVNNRHLKVTVRGSDPYPSLEAEVEKVLRRRVKRGSLLVQLRVVRGDVAAERTIDETVLAAYLRQIRSVCRSVGVDTASVYSGVLELPGVLGDTAPTTRTPESEWPVVEAVLEEAVEELDKTRRAEGAAMADELLGYHAAMRAEVQNIRDHLPAVMTAYRGRLLDRVRQATTAAGVAVDETNLIRELALFADRSDVAEELTRLDAHLDSFAEIVRTGGDGPGRRLDFVAQEIGREVNTTGSKAGDVTVSRHAVEMKATLEKIRELVQNVE